MFKKTVLTLSSAMVLASTSAFAQITVEQVQEKFPGTPITSVKPASSFPGLYELVVGKNNVFYVNSSIDKLMIGHIVDLATQFDETQARKDELSRVDFTDLPKSGAIKVVKGDGSRVFAVFSDPDCPFCKRLEQAVQQLTDYTMYLYPTPLLRGIAPSVNGVPVVSQRIWCSRDQYSAWLDYVMQGKQPSSNGTCNAPMRENLTLVKELGISGTPTLIGQNGKSHSGFLDADKLNVWLNENGKRK